MKKMVFLLTFMTIVLSACSSQVTNPRYSDPDALHVRRDFFLFGPAEITLYGVECTADFQDERCSLLDVAFDMLFDMEERFNVNAPGGEVEQINEHAGIEPVVVSEDTFRLIEYAIRYSLSTDMLFNAAIGLLVNLWNIGFEGTRRPSENELSEVLPLLNPAYVTLDPDNFTVFLEKEGMRLDLGGIAKGFMPDEVVKFLYENGIERALLRVGGEIVTIGSRHTDGRPFNVGIENPFFDEDSLPHENLAGSVHIRNQAVVTSGTYNRYFASQETQTIYHHILDSRTGMPFDTDFVSISVIAETGLLGEVYTKVFFGMDVADILEYVETLENIEVVLITNEKRIYLSSGIADYFFLRVEGFEVIMP